MITVERDFIPMLLGSDINTYSMARAFHEAYGIRSLVIGKAFAGPSRYSKICDFRVNRKLDEKEEFLAECDRISKEFSDKKIILLGCGDNYLRRIIESKPILPKNFIVPYINADILDSLIKKECFYETCEKYNLPYPKTFVYTREKGDNFSLPFDFPVIAKPSDSVTYWEHPFPTQKKVYKIDSAEELKKVLSDIYGAGYTDEMIIQEFIEGDDSYMRVMTCFSNKEGKVELMSLGHVILEEHTPHGLGNHAVILSDCNKELAMKIKNFLEAIGYVGFSNFDIKYDKKTDTYKLFEINLRQGRSNYYVTGAGDNLAEYLVSSFIYGKTHDFKIADSKSLWSVIPISIAYKYLKDDNLSAEIRKRKKNGAFVNPLFYHGDLSPKRLLILLKSHYSHYKKYRTYYK